ncbi:hypothetical protein FIA58_001400 [Flavobacterium jejuense]|uniref:Glycosyl transferase family 51 domain-containing protein n=1 Tax=Flavobacterium jejuense TaxID=1544455 RepID=A0ABX0IM62_9FLAO|nr:transglycosylase domain-containing protein [Flavobacterium jejuense]NHN24316.1 hypothetical protein [Flavobacterium jejuense]
MKLKKIAKGLLKTGIICLVLLVVIYNLLLSDFNPIFDTQNYKQLTTALDQAKEESFEEIIETYDSIYTSPSFKELAVSNLFSYSNKQCPCLNITRMYHSYYNNRFESIYEGIFFTLKLERKYTQRECLKLLLKDSDYLYQNRGIKKAAHYYYNKELKDLNQKERITLILMLENPTLYNPERNRKMLQRKVLHIQKMLKNKF